MIFHDKWVKGVRKKVIFHDNGGGGVRKKVIWYDMGNLGVRHMYFSPTKCGNFVSGAFWNLCDQFLIGFLKTPREVA